MRNVLCNKQLLRCHDSSIYDISHMIMSHDSSMYET